MMSVMALVIRMKECTFLKKMNDILHFYSTQKSEDDVGELYHHPLTRNLTGNEKSCRRGLFFNHLVAQWLKKRPEGEKCQVSGRTLDDHVVVVVVVAAVVVFAAAVAAAVAAVVVVVAAAAVGGDGGVVAVFVDVVVVVIASAVGGGGVIGVVVVVLLLLCCCFCYCCWW